ncbi:MAG: hypothetical protein QHH09_02595 [Microgenomates group bacterium]|nr:hypothetical protein [Microgenomates group bacterium]
MPETPPESESQEIFSSQNEMVALQVRMALYGEALNPQKKDLPKVEEGQLTNLEKTIKIAANGSTLERLLWWEKEWRAQVAADSSLANLTE